MLLKFTVENYKSFKERAVLDMSATRISDCPCHVVDILGRNVLPIAAIYGANASGKSTLLDAFRFMSDYVARSLFFGGDTSIRVIFNEKYYFAFDDASRDKETSFEVVFTAPQESKNEIFTYGFSLKGGKVTCEELSSRKKTSSNKRVIFSRVGQKVSSSRIDSTRLDALSQMLQEETLVASLGYRLKIEEVSAVFRWFNSVKSFLSEGDERRAQHDAMILAAKISEDPEFARGISEFTHSIDKTIVRVHASSEEERAKLYFVHNSNSGNEVMIPLSGESSGIKKMVKLYLPIAGALREGAVLIIDEIDAKLHPLLVSQIIANFTSPEKNPRHAQLIFTTHDPLQLSGDRMRRDEVWFVQKGNGQESNLYRLATRTGRNNAKIRKDEDFVKNYLLGKYGAVPDVGGGLRLVK